MYPPRVEARARHELLEALLPELRHLPRRRLVFGRIVASEIEEPMILVNLVYSG